MIRCPHCQEVLFHIAEIAPGVTAKLAGDPELRRSDYDGRYFAFCPNCLRRVWFNYLEMPTGTPGRFELSAKQQDKAEHGLEVEPITIGPNTGKWRPFAWFDLGGHKVAYTGAPICDTEEAAYAAGKRWLVDHIKVNFK